jgi:hypothetical protein
MELELHFRPPRRRDGDAQYTLAAALIWAAIAFGLWQASMPTEPQPIRLLAADCNRS